MNDFMRGYLEEIVKDCNDSRLNIYDLSDVSIAMALDDCTRRSRHHPTPVLKDWNFTGKLFWKWRQKELCKNFPPLNLSVKDGIIHLEKRP